MPPSRRLPLSQHTRQSGCFNNKTSRPNRRLPILPSVGTRRDDNITTTTPAPANKQVFNPYRSTPTQPFQQADIRTQQTQRQEPSDPAQTTGQISNQRHLQHTQGRRFPQPQFSPIQPRRTRTNDNPDPIRNVRPRMVVTNRCGDPQSDTIRLATLNVISGRAERLVSAARALQQMNVDLAVLTETKITDEYYTRHSFGYEIRASKAPSSSQGGVAICWRDNEVSQAEGIRFHGSNVVKLRSNFR
jgi:hypothetical protein